MEVTTVSCTQKISAEIEILDFSKLEVSRRDNANSYYFSELPFTVGLVSSYDGKIEIRRKYGYLENIKLFIPEVKLINLTMILNGEQFNCKNGTGLDFTDRRMRSEELKCKILLTFEPADEQVLQDQLYHTLSQMNLKSMEIFRNDITISVQGKEFGINKNSVQGKEFGFNKKYLSNISSVFKEMFENCSEDNEIDGKLTLPDETTIKTMTTFTSLLKNDRIKIEDFSTELYIFAEKYDIPCLLKFCSQILGDNLNNNNVIDIVKAANTTEDDVLLKKAAKFLNKNPSIIHDNLPFQTYLKENCSKLLMFMILRE